MNEQTRIDAVTAALAGRLLLWPADHWEHIDEGTVFVETVDITPPELNPFEGHYQTKTVQICAHRTGMIIGMWYVDSEPVRLEIV